MKLSRMFSPSRTETVEIKNFNGLLKFICESDYSGSTFQNNHRSLDDFVSTELAIIDIDSNLSIQDALNRLNGYRYILATTKSHQKVKKTKAGKEIPACDRFRIILFFDKLVTNHRDFKHSYLTLCELFPELDSSCAEASRFFYKSDKVISSCASGLKIKSLVAPEAVQPEREYRNEQILGKLSSQTKDFLKEGAKSGEWNNRLFKACIDLHEQNYPMETAKIILDKVQDPLDEYDLNTLESAYSKEPKYGPRTDLTIKGFEEVKSKVKDQTDWEGLKIPLAKSNLSDWYDELFQVNNVVYKDNVICVGKKEYRYDIFINLIYWATERPVKVKIGNRGQNIIDNNGNNVYVKAFTLGKAAAISYIDTWIEKQNTINKNKILKDIKFAGSNDEIRKFVDTITDINKDITEAIIRQFIYNVKLKSMNRHPAFIFMPVLYGEQGVGKSIAVQKLVEPLKGLVSPADFSVFKDERKFMGLFGKKLVLEFDEMSKANKTEIEAVKNKITAKNLNFRLLGTHQDQSMFNRSSMIGTSNTPLIDLLYDDTGKRRFFEIECKKEHFWEQLQTIDSLRMWQSVDTNQEPPIKGYLEEVAQVQVGYKNVNSVEEFLIEEDLIPSENLESVKVYRKSLYSNYVDFMSEQRRTNVTRNKFYNFLRKNLEEVEMENNKKGFLVKQKYE